MFKKLLFLCALFVLSASQLHATNGNQIRVITQIDGNEILVKSSAPSLDALAVAGTVTADTISVQTIEITQLNRDLDASNFNISNVGTLAASELLITNTESLRVTAQFFEEVVVTININDGGVVTQYFIPAKVVAPE